MCSIWGVMKHSTKWRLGIGACKVAYIYNCILLYTSLYLQDMSRALSRSHEYHCGENAQDNTKTHALIQKPLPYEDENQCAATEKNRFVPRHRIMTKRPYIARASDSFRSMFLRQLSERSPPCPSTPSSSPLSPSSSSFINLW
jgi:hypothetical protein